MGNQRKTTFLRKHFNDLSRQEQEYLRNLIRSLFHLQNSGATPAVESPSADRHGNTVFHDGSGDEK